MVSEGYQGGVITVSTGKTLSYLPVSGEGELIEPSAQPDTATDPDAVADPDTTSDPGASQELDARRRSPKSDLVARKMFPIRKDSEKTAAFFALFCAAQTFSMRQN